MKRALRILVPIDFSSHSWETLRFALGMRELVEPALVLLHVVPRSDYHEWEPAESMDDSSQARAHHLARLEQEVDRHLPERDAPEVVCRIANGVPFKEICAVAEVEKVEMIIIGTHGRTGLSHLLIGSTAERVVQHASCPVLSIKPKLI